MCNGNTPFTYSWYEIFNLKDGCIWDNKPRVNKQVYRIVNVYRFILDRMFLDMTCIITSKVPSIVMSECYNCVMALKNYSIAFEDMS